MEKAQLAAMVDHTLLKPEATRAQVEALVAEGVELGTYSVCVSPSQVPLKVPESLKLCVVCGFPSGAHTTATKAGEAREAVAAGVDEVDMVVNLSWVKDGLWDRVQADIAAVKKEVPAPKLLKVIIESAALTDEEIVKCCQAAQAAGADFVKTSTGFHPAGGASTHAVALMRQTVGDTMGVKASGGIHTGAEALAMVEAGASRLGLSGTRKVLETL
ncbi:deoxyribose-phosphate aldolase [Mobiluncus sp.]|uniref:deoxyribose-phosphate aldolase n=1 Tax=Mobiluncus sp. TaxID=47293 RepID=UPI002A91A25F|nr:deoxyribose-phosphate aldolase [Mobiluncus sp.]MDY6077693.1 deoxyribose-phosphate aldolase [Mobiluncus sp.]